MPMISEETTEEYVVPALGAGFAGLASFEIVKRRPEIAGITVALGTMFMLKRKW